MVCVNNLHDLSLKMAENIKVFKYFSNIVYEFHIYFTICLYPGRMTSRNKTYVSKL